MKLCQMFQRYIYLYMKSKQLYNITITFGKHSKNFLFNKGPCSLLEIT